ncbi:MAG TPA: GIY-YIG nuclease family protein [Gammaproteobacteria bacterium]|nr:GIY-YIG nuclease family protein [Gammaproteobacteria bacterium]
MAFTLYILECADGTLYVGHTDNLDRRMQQHGDGKADAYTASRHPLKLRHVEEFGSREEALTMERKLKGWSHAKKCAYMAGNWTEVSRLAKGKHKQSGCFEALRLCPSDHAQRERW